MLILSWLLINLIFYLAIIIKPQKIHNTKWITKATNLLLLEINNQFVNINHIFTTLTGILFIKKNQLFYLQLKFAFLIISNSCLISHLFHKQFVILHMTIVFHLKITHIYHLAFLIDLNIEIFPPNFKRRLVTLERQLTSKAKNRRSTQKYNNKT